jgi:hypothetical protein
MINSKGYLVESFQSFLNSAVFEDSNLSQLGLPKAMIKKIHTKDEHYSEKYPTMGHTYKSRAAVPMPYKYYIPSPDIEIPEPLKLRGRKSNRSPFQDKEVKSEYTDFAWYLQSIPFGEIRIFIVNKEIDFFMFLYHKQPSKGATGEQYAVMAWDPERRRVVDYGYSELTTSGVDRSQLRGVHDTTGGNTNGKIQEFVRAVTRQGEKKYAPSLEKPLYIYDLGVAPSREPRVTREKRESAKGDTLSLDFMKVFVPKFKNIVAKARPQMIERLTQEVSVRSWRHSNITQILPGINEIAEILQAQPTMVQFFLFNKFKDFRKEIFEEGRFRTQGGASAYDTTSGFELEKDARMDPSFLYTGGTEYSVDFQKYSPDEEGPDPETGFREAQPEKYKRNLPVAGEYASIPSMIKAHTLDGLIDKFTAFIFTGKVKTPKVNVAGAFGWGAGENKFKTSSSNKGKSNAEPEEGDLLF